MGSPPVYADLTLLGTSDWRCLAKLTFRSRRVCTILSISFVGTPSIMAFSAFCTAAMASRNAALPAEVKEISFARRSRVLRCCETRPRSAAIRNVSLKEGAEIPSRSAISAWVGWRPAAAMALKRSNVAIEMPRFRNAGSTASASSWVRMPACPEIESESPSTRTIMEFE